MTEQRYDIIFAGGGLSAGLAALAMIHRQPTARILIVERGATLGGNHTWCFHGSDVPDAARAWVDPLVAHRWAGYSVRFPRRTRRLASPYACITSSQLHDALMKEAKANPSRLSLRLECAVRSLTATTVELEDGQLRHGALVVDTRGPEHHEHGAAGYQKFVGLELEVEPSHALLEPILIDACLPQTDGFRFMYALPFGEARVLVEDTYFSESSTLDRTAHDADILAYAATIGLTVRGIVRREHGVLPMPFQGSASRNVQSPLRAGYGGGFFHPVTGYSLPVAIRFACALAESDIGSLHASALLEFTERFDRQLPFLHALTRAMFTWFPPEQRYNVLEHFYRLPEPLIERFYAAELTWRDRIRIFVGAPPRGLSMRRTLGIPTEVTP